MEEKRPEQDLRDQAQTPTQAPSTTGPELEQARKRSGVSCLTLFALLGMLMVAAAIVVPNFFGTPPRGQLTACKSNLKNIGTALEMYSTDFSGHYPTSLVALTPNYLKTIPECPAAASTTYKAYFGPSAPENPDKYQDYYYVECHGGNHKHVSVTGNYPAYSGIRGLIERAP